MNKTAPFETGTITSARKLLAPDRQFFFLAAIYGVGIGILTLAVPIAVQALLNTVVNTAVTPFIVLLAVLLFAVLFISAVLIASRDYAMELFQRRFLARITSEAVLRLTHADQPHMDGINRVELVNRFFEIIHVQKNAPALLTEGFFIALQAIVGLIVVSFYHPFLFIYNLLFAGSLLLIWKTWSKPAIRKAIALSNSKYALVQWIEEIARVNQMFKSERSIGFALEQTDDQTAAYLTQKKSYFKTTFSQTLAFLALYCLGSATLLGLGGVLVARNQLSLGQLVGAELIMSAIFYSTSKLGYYASVYYDLRANLDKLNYFFNLPLEKIVGQRLLDHTIDHSVTFTNVSTPYRGHRFFFNCDFPSNSKILVKSSEAAGSKIFLDLIKGYREPSQGRILIGGQDLCDFDIHDLRNHVLSVDSLSIVEGTIRRFFDLYAPDATKDEIISALELVGLDQLIDKLPQRLETKIVPSGYPLLQNEVLRLKLAAVIAAEPAILIITETFDIVPLQIRKRILQELCNRTNTLLITFTNLKEWAFFDQYIVMEKDGTYSFPDVASAKAHLELNASEQS
ncbi:MAG: ABC transporter ATP-binding protein [Alphaproteobacteria bacterium]|nr:ABC transporter ATP-binding protein [Alphaproteobacteria bacterium]